MQRALSPPSCNNINGLTTTKNNVTAQPPITTTSSPTRISSSHRLQHGNEPCNVIYASTGVMGKPEMINDATENVGQIKSSVRSYGADGSLLRKIGK